MEDFINITQTSVKNAARLSLFMVSVMHRLRQELRLGDAEFSVLALKAYCPSYRHLTETIKILPQKLDQNLVSQIFRQVTALGSIYAPTANACAL